MKRRWILIGRLHLDGKNEWNSWKELSKYLKTKAKSIESLKALIFTDKSKRDLKRKINIYNKKHNVDFFINKREVS